MRNLTLLAIRTLKSGESETIMNLRVVF